MPLQQEPGLGGVRMHLQRYKSAHDRAVGALEEVALSRQVSNQVINADIVQGERIEGVEGDDELPAYRPPMYEENQSQGLTTTLDASDRPLPPPPDYSPRKLDRPIVVPQQRPHDVRSSFVVSYAPILQLHGIDRETFTNVVQKFNSALRDASVLQVIGISGSIIRLDSGRIRPAIHQINTRADTYLQHVNCTLFQPRGLLAVVISDNVRDNIIGPAADLESNTAIISNRGPSSSSRVQNQGNSSVFTTITNRLMEAHDYIEAYAVKAQDTVDDYTLQAGEILGPQARSYGRYPSRFQLKLARAQARYDRLANRAQGRVPDRSEGFASGRMERASRRIARIELHQAARVRRHIGPLYLVVVNDVQNV